MAKALVSPKVKTLALPILYLASSALLLVLSGKLSFNTILKNQGEIRAIQKENATLDEKSNVLQKLDSQAFLVDKAVLAALPAQDSALSLSSQIRSIADEMGVEISNVAINTSSSEKENKVVKITFTAVSSGDTVFRFLKELPGLAPVNSIKTMSMTENSEGITAQLVVQSYWARLPDSIPAITDPIVELDSSELGVLEEIKTLRFPEFGDLKPFEGIARNPFN